MKPYKLSIAALAGAMAIAGLEVSAQAQTALNIAGASAGQPFVSEVPVTICDNPTGTGGNIVSGSTAPRIFMDGPLGVNIDNRTANSKFVTWVCEGTNAGVGLPNIIIRYQSSGSGDGVDKINAFPTVNNDGVTPNPAARQVYVEPNPANCGAPTNDTDAHGRSRTLYPSCTLFSANPNTNAAAALVVNLGVADVAPSTFNQSTTGWNGGAIQGTINAGPKADNNLTIAARPLAVPFSMVVGSAVKSVNPATGAVIGPLRNFTRLQIEAIFSRNVKNWNQFQGIGADTDGNGIVNASDNQTIVICGRRAGSGTKASFNATLMKDIKEATGSSPNNIATFNLTLGTPTTNTGSTGPVMLWGISNGDVRDCIQGNPAPTIPSNDPFPFPGVRPAHPTAVAYMEADQASTVNPAAGTVVSVDGGKARRNDTNNGQVPPASEAIYAGNEKENVRCGKLEYFSFEAFNTRNVPAPTQNETTLINAFLTRADDPNIINALPGTGDYWLAASDLFVFKNADKGPVLWKTTGLPAQKCLSAVNDQP
jgi:hypothetical protein